MTATSAASASTLPRRGFDRANPSSSMVPSSQPHIVPIGTIGTVGLGQLGCRVGRPDIAVPVKARQNVSTAQCRPTWIKIQKSPARRARNALSFAQCSNGSYEV